jgi:riboflavin-specific deaminase-like protein
MLLPEDRTVARQELVDLYDWPGAPWVRACVVMSLDGSLVGPDGLSGSISSEADRAVLAAARSMADAYLVGAGTVRDEGYGPVRARPELEEARRSRGQAPAPTLAVVSRSCRFDWSEARFQHSDNRPLILTTRRAGETDVRAAQSAGCEVLVIGEDGVDTSVALEALAGRGLARVTIEGGPSLLRRAVEADLVDELDLTISPVLTGGGSGAGGIPAMATRLRLVQLLSDDDMLFTRYARPGGA